MRKAYTRTKPYVRVNNKCGGITLREPRIYDIWRKMLGRCYKPGHHNYESYGLRGISVCDEWKDVETFAIWSRSNGYSDDLTIERIDNNGNYSPYNCKWATSLEQGRNKRNNIRFTHGDLSLTAGEWSEITGIPEATLWHRLINKKWCMEDALWRPVRKWPMRKSVDAIDLQQGLVS